MPRKISVLVVDDSAFMRKALKRMLSSDPAIEVAGEARDGLEAVAEVKRLRPDVVTLDVKMSGIDGLEALKRIMAEQPTPVLMVSSLTSEGGGVTLAALEAGAVDFIDKSSCHTSMDILEIADSLVEKVKVIAGVKVSRMREVMPPPATPEPMTEEPRENLSAAEGNPSCLVAIGASTGGPISLERVLTRIPGDYPGAIVVVQHMPPGFTKSLAERLNLYCQVEVREAKEDDLINPGTVYIAPAGYHLKIRKSEQRYRVVLSRTPLDTPHIPSVDVMMKSAAKHWEGPLLAIVLTGMGCDGAEGVRDVSARGGLVIGQDEETCVVYGMPRAAWLTGCVKRQLPLDGMAAAINRFR